MRRVTHRGHFVLIPFVALVYLVSSIPVSAQVGPDVIVGDVREGLQLGRAGDPGSGTVAVGFATDACNKGDAPAHWFVLPSVDHPGISVNLYRLRSVDGSDRFEQIGYSWLKHGFAATQDDFCGFGCIPSDGTQLGVGCSDVYSGIQYEACGGAVREHQAPRSVIHPYTGAMPTGDELGSGGGCTENFPSANHIGHTHTDISHRLQVPDTDLMPTLNPGVRYFGEGQYIVPHEFAAGNGNQNNNVSYREFSISEPTPGVFAFTDLGSTFAEQSAINAWPGASQSLIEPAPLSDGQAILAYQVTDLGKDRWHYEYAVYNRNLDVAIGSLSIPMPSGVIVDNLEFFGIPHHAPETNADNYSNDPWAISTTGGAVSWSTDSFVVDPLANAVRWGRMYNFRFDAMAAPVNVNANVGLFKNGTTASAATEGPGPAAPTDCNENGITDNCDLTCADACAVSGCGQSPDCNGNNLPDECDVDFGFVEDCNETGTPDACDVVSGTSDDCTGNGIPDECEEDCNNNGFADVCDLASGTSDDCNENQQPDDCESGFAEDCNNNEVTDFCDIYVGTSPDANGNDIPDECEAQSGILYVDDDGPSDPGPGDSGLSDPDENGSPAHPFDAIQEAIDVAFPGDVVVIRDGLYKGFGNRLISYQGKAITVRSENGPDNCIVDGEFLVSLFIFDNEEERDSRLEDLTILNGPESVIPNCSDQVESIRCVGSSPTITQCFIDGGARGVAVLNGAYPLFSYCTFMNDCRAIRVDVDSGATVIGCHLSGAGAGGINPDGISSSGNLTMVSTRIVDYPSRGITVRVGGNAVIDNCLIARNGGSGGAILVSHTATIRNCTIVENRQGGIYGCGALVSNSIVRDNVDPFGEPRDISGDGCLPTVRYSNVGEPPGPSIHPTNINADPQFIDAANGDYRLSLGSLSVDSGSNDAAPIDVTDLDGDGDTTETIPFDLDGRPRILDAPGSPGTGIDMGAYEVSDCNENGVRDEEDIAEGTSADCNGNAWPDECDISFGISRDCNLDGVPNECEADCDGNNQPDICEFRDCNLNGVFDVCDIQGGISLDVDGSNVPDECECPPPPPLPGPNELVANRYLAINANTPTQSTALRVTITEVPSGFEDFLGKQLWVGGLRERCENSAQASTRFEECGPAPGIEPKRFWTASFVCDPFYTDWGRFGTVYVADRLVVPGATYVVEANEESCGPGSATLFSDPLVQRMGDWGDVVQDNATCPPPNPDGRVDVVTDIVALLKKFGNNFCALRKARADLQPEEVDFVVDIVDVLFALGAFSGNPYPFDPGPDPCP